MTGARILAIAGFTAGILGMIGGFADIPQLIGAANLTMLVGNAYVMLRRK